MWHTRSFHGTVLSASSGDSLADFIGLSPSAMRTAAPRSSGGAPREGSAARWGARLKAEAADDARESIGNGSGRGSGIRESEHFGAVGSQREGWVGLSERNVGAIAGQRNQSKM